MILEKAVEGLVGANLFAPTNAMQHHEAMWDFLPTAFSRMIVLDTHIWVNWILCGDAALTLAVVGAAKMKNREGHYANTR